MYREPNCVLSIDVEDWFHILELPTAPRLEEWDRLPSRVEYNFRCLLDLVSQTETHCTCFFVGWVAERYPQLVRAAAEAGHEIASHGWAHRLAYSMTAAEFYADAARSKDVLEQICGRRVLGYRSAGFSLSERSEWVFDELLRAGYVYDASLFPARRAHGGWCNGHYAPYLVKRRHGRLIEFPASMRKVLGQPLCFFGGGYLRLFPISVVDKMVRGVLGEGRPVIFYIHPREIDPGQPRIAMSRWRHFKSYVNLRTTEGKLRYLLRNFEFTTLEELMDERSLWVAENTFERAEAWTLRNREFRTGGIL